jgi:hypothetical protein
MHDLHEIEEPWKKSKQNINDKGQQNIFQQTASLKRQPVKLSNYLEPFEALW